MTHRLESSRLARRRVALALAAPLFAVVLVAPTARALDDEPGTRLGLSPSSVSGGGLLGFLNSDRLTHHRSLSFGYASGSGPSGSSQGGASFTDFFAYRLRQNLMLDLALEYNFTSSFRSSTEERGQFSVLPSFALEYHPSQNSLLRFSYERFGPGSPLLTGRRFYPY